jgi:hypothetical protein
MSKSGKSAYFRHIFANNFFVHFCTTFSSKLLKSLYPTVQCVQCTYMYVKFDGFGQVRGVQRGHHKRDLPDPGLQLHHQAGGGRGIRQLQQADRQMERNDRSETASNKQLNAEENG